MSGDKSKKQVEQWYKVARLGRGKYILRCGVLPWGLPMFLFMVIFLPLLRGVALDEIFTAGNIVLGLILWSVGGYLFGWFMWWLNERRYGLPPSKNIKQR